ncbi:adrenodoxin, mitochondrial isoform X1 [Equus asinus]
MASLSLRAPGCSWRPCLVSRCRHCLRCRAAKFPLQTTDAWRERGPWEPRSPSPGAACAFRKAGPIAAAGCPSEDKVTVHFINRDGKTLTAKGKVGDSLLDVVIENNLDIDGFGACEGTLACSTCHLIFEDHVFEKLEAITDEENDMLDLAFGLTDRSRLGCQVCLTKSMDNMTVRVPEAVADARQSVDMGKNS